MKDLTVDIPDLESTLTSITGNLWNGKDFASLFTADTSALSDTLKAAVPEFDFSEVKRSPPALATAHEKLRKFGESLLCLIVLLVKPFFCLYQFEYSTVVTFVLFDFESVERCYCKL